MFLYKIHPYFVYYVNYVLYFCTYIQMIDNISYCHLIMVFKKYL